MLEHPRIRERLTDAHRALLERARDFFAESHVRRFVSRSTGQIERSFWSEASAARLLGAGVPAEHGGQGLGALASVVIREAMQPLRDNGLSLGFHVHNDVGMQWLLECPNPGLRQRHLGPALRGEQIFCTCYTDARKDVPALARAEGDEIRVDAHKGFSVNGVHADLCFVTAELAGQTVTLLIEKDRPGVSVVRVHRRLASQIIDQAEIRFDGVRVPRDHVVADHPAQRLLLWNWAIAQGRYGCALDGYYLQKKLLGHLLEHLGGRAVSGRRMLDWPLHRRTLAEAAVRAAASRAGLVDALEDLDRGPAPARRIDTLKSFSVDAATDLALRAMDAEGGAGAMIDGQFLPLYGQVLGLRFSSGAQSALAELRAGHCIARAKARRRRARGEAAAPARSAAR